MILGIDVGNYSLKSSERNLNIKSLVNNEENILGSKTVLEYDNKKFVIGEGNFETELNKSSKENFIPLLYTGIALSSNDKFNQVVCGLPINQYKTNKLKIEEEINNNKMKVVTVNGVTRELIITDVKVYPEGIGAYYSLGRNKDVIIIDVGGRTTDIAYICNNKHSESRTVNVGTLNIYKDITTKLNADYGLDLDLQMADKIIKTNKFNVDNKSVDLKFITNILKVNFLKIKEELDFSFPEARVEDIVLVGGGANLFIQAFKKRYENCDIAADPIYANAKGFKRVGEMLWH